MDTEEKVVNDGAEMNELNSDVVEKSSNILLGIVGAVIGSIIGVALWVAIYYFGYIAAIAGFVMIACAMKGYEILGGALDKKGIIVASIISFIMVFVANHLSWTLDAYVELKKYEKVSFRDVFNSMPDMIKAFGLQADYLKDLGVGYLLTLIGGVSTIINKFKQVKGK